MNELEVFSTISVKTVNEHLVHAKQYLLEISQFFEDSPDKQKKINFIIEQISLLNSNSYNYSPHTIIFCSILQSISPHCYKFLRTNRTNGFFKNKLIFISYFCFIINIPIT